MNIRDKLRIFIETERRNDDRIRKHAAESKKASPSKQNEKTTNNKAVKK